jgi:lipopolysaccharide transport system permease protein
MEPGKENYRGRKTNLAKLQEIIVEIKSNEKSLTSNWTEILEARRSLFDLNIRELWHYRDLLVNFIKRDFVATYKQTILGPLWFFIQPLLTSFIFTLVFAKFAKVTTGGLPYIPFYLSGLIIWNFFSESLIKISNSFQTNKDIFSKVYFPRLIVPISILISGLTRFLVQFILLVTIITFHVQKGEIHDPFSPDLLYIPFLLLFAGGFSFGLGLILTSLTTRYRDLTNLLGFGVQLLMYATPVIYPISSLSEEHRSIVSMNPLSPVIESFRQILIDPQTFAPQGLLYSLTLMLIVLATGILIFSKVEKNFIDSI